MKYFFDTEFIECFKKPIPWLPTIGQFNRPYHSIQLISIGIVAEDGREYYAISSEFNPADANPWVKENVIKKLEVLWVRYSNKQIAQDIVRFINSEPVKTCKSAGATFLSEESKKNIQKGYLEPEFYAYYADYDWVVFCSLFGTMMDLPKGFPMYCRDLKQMLDEKVTVFCKHEIADTSFDQALTRLKTHAKYPTQFNEHNALDDAKWNYQLYKFLKSL